jgi:SAM-dependent methyltransferase
MDGQRRYWDRAASQKTFTHPIDREWLQVFVKPADRILDYGCGYGRVLGELAALGYGASVGVDFSARMIARGARLHPDLDLRVLAEPPLPEADGSFDVVMLFAVLTCIPDDGAQDALIQECRRLLRRDGLLYISDMPLQSSPEYRERYNRGAQRHGVYGVFETSDGAIVRHHDEGRLDSWLTGFKPLGRRDIDVVTMNGAPARAVQRLGSKTAV